MTYVEGFIVPVPIANRQAYRQHAAEVWPMLSEFGVARLVEAWASDVLEGEVTDFSKAVQAKEDETIVFSWFEYPSREVRDAVHQRTMSDPRMAEMSRSMPFDGKRMIIGGFASLLDRGSARGSYVDGLVLPVPHTNRQAYLAMAEKLAGKVTGLGALRVVEFWGDDLQVGTVTDFRRAVQAKDEENVVFSWIEWPDKAARDAAWPKLMKDPDMQPDHGNMPFDGKRMFWGGFEVILDSGKQQPELEVA